MLEVETTATFLPLELVVSQEAVGGVAGLAATVAVRLASSTTSYLDWADGAFKTSGWVLRDGPMTALGNGRYRRALDPAALGLPAGTFLVAEYAATVGAVVEPAEPEVIRLVASAATTAGGIAAAVWDEPMASHLTPGTTGAVLATDEPTASGIE